jgi:orotidine-5'-phosphate decarboxylase
MSAVFADRLIESMRRKDTPLCVGLDPFPDRIPALFGDAREEVDAVARFGEAIVAMAAQHAGVLKPQLGLFEPFGPDGVRIAQEVVAEARAAGMIVILDAKRGDIGTTAEGYARATLGSTPGFDADCVTVSPYLGKDSLEPFIALAERERKGVAVLVRTSNPGAKDLQDLVLAGHALWENVALMIADATDRLRGANGWSGLMAVAGATYPDEARKLRALLPDSLFLVPGYGAQGGNAEDAVAGFVKNAKGREGGVVNSSRAVTYPDTAQRAKSMADWRAAIGDAMAAAAAELRAACVA